MSLDGVEDTSRFTWDSVRQRKSSSSFAPRLASGQPCAHGLKRAVGRRGRGGRMKGRKVRRRQRHVDEDGRLQ